MFFWESNREILIKEYGGLLEELTTESDDLLAPEDIKIETTPTGEPSLCVKGIYVHSPRDPIREAQRILQSAETENGPVIILGFGLGYAAQAVAYIAAESGRPVIVVEKYRNLLLKALELRDFRSFLSKNRIIFVLGGSGDGITDALNIAGDLMSAGIGGKNKPSVIRNRALISIDEDWYKTVEEKICTWTMRDEVNTATLKRFGRRWVRNLSRNMSAIRDYPGISRLTGFAASDTGGLGIACGKPMPVFLAAAGPSLDNVSHLLRDIHRRCIVVAVDTNLRFFVKNGVPPDFVLVVDPQFWNSRHLDRCICECTRSRTALIAESAVYPPVLSLPFKNIFLCGSLFPFGTFIEKQVDPKGRLGSGGSVTTTAWDFARTLGGNEIWIAGLDLAFPDLKTHFRGARFEERANYESVRFNPVEKWIVRALREGFPFKARSGTGGQVLTDRRLSLYATWFENQFRQHPEVLNLSLFNDGLAIAGLQTAEAGELLSLPERRDEIDRRLDMAFLQIEADFNGSEQAIERAERYENAVSVLTRGLENIRNAAKKGAEITQIALEHSLKPSQQNKVLKDLDKIMRRVTESEVKEVAGFLFPPVEYEKGKNCPADVGDPFCSYLKSSLSLFSGLAEAAEFNLRTNIR
ncbi:MAG: DUF115 domain-containing protein [Treponema sp.]|nr:DUF115 domain-containing protein [Treponema sp.]